jgi:hypothetical protein
MGLRKSKRPMRQAFVHREANKDVPWWRKELKEEHKVMPKLENRKNTDRTKFKKALTPYNNKFNT